MSHFIHSGKRNIVHSFLTTTHPSIPASSYPYLFPLYNPSSLDAIFFWEIDSQRRSGHVLVSGLKPGVGHSDLQSIIDEVENAKVKRSLFAQTGREKVEILEAIKNSEWNVNGDPIAVSLHDCAVVRHDFSTGYVVAEAMSLALDCGLT
jgi:trafficking protein particle complex subunit 8